MGRLTFRVLPHGLGAGPHHAIERDRAVVLEDDKNAIWDMSDNTERERNTWDVYSIWEIMYAIQYLYMEYMECMGARYGISYMENYDVCGIHGVYGK